MGECNYYLKARFRSPTAATAAAPRLAALLAEGEAAYEHWQGSRGRPGPGGAEPVPAAEFWAGFRARFPRVVGYLRDLAGAPDWSNALAGRLGCLVDPRPVRAHPPAASLVRSGDLLLLRLDMIWHGTDMRLLERYCRADLGAVGAGSVSEEDFDLGEDSDLEGSIETGGLDPFDAIVV